MVKAFDYIHVNKQEKCLGRHAFNHLFLQEMSWLAGRGKTPDCNECDQAVRPARPDAR